MEISFNKCVIFNFTTLQEYNIHKNVYIFKCELKYCSMFKCLLNECSGQIIILDIMGQNLVSLPKYSLRS